MTMDQTHQNELKARMQAVPNEQRHALVLSASGGALFPDGTGVKPVVWFFAKRVSGIPLPTGQEDEQEQFFIIDLRDAAVLKRSIDKMLEGASDGNGS